jgi:hypothetical protein
MMQEIQRKQIVLIHIAKSQLSLDDETYRHILKDRYRGKKSSKELSYSQAEDLIRHFKGLGWKGRKKSQKSEVRSQKGKEKESAAKYDNLGTRPGMASPGMLRKIEAIWAEVSYSADLPKSLRSFLWSKFAVSDIIWLDMTTARAVIESLKSMKRRLLK